MSRAISKSDHYKVGIIGTGFLGRALGREFKRHERGAVVAATDINDEELQKAADEFDFDDGSQYNDYEAMLDGEELDAIVITTPHALHAEQINAGLDHDLHVLCEKPLCTDLDDAKQLVQRVEDSDKTVMLGFQRHLDTAFLKTREYWHDEGHEPKFITAEVTQDWINAVGDSWKANPALSGGGQLYDTGSHLVDSVLWTTGLVPQSVTAEMVFEDDEQRLDTQAMLTVRFENDAVATIAVSGDAPRVNEGIHMWGDDGSTQIDGTEWNPRRYSEINSDGDMIEPNVNWGPEKPKAEAFIEAIEGEEEPPATVLDGFKTVAVTEAAYEAAQTGERVNVDLSLD
ncbi:Gfo/Idh/MocA family protein [Haloprofundus salilacus]|uniref:Gfo/Idh/MocA family protein n=1 Tax=Haloprofundus salilacus TaxID=2876190 RepID=UPI001CCF2AA7|nr:Gfo/Idh/MocA family oxidoreductase [Haloprofundus salilacus]